MKVEGMPDIFWVVTEPSPVSTLHDICFRCNFTQFAQQIRGGLHETEIVGIFAEEEQATREAWSLIEDLPDPSEDDNTKYYPSPWDDWSATQAAVRGVDIRDKSSGSKVTVEPPKHWGDDWTWRGSEDGAGVVFYKGKGT